MNEFDPDARINLAHFNKGRDLAVRMLREGNDHTLIERAAIAAADRNDPTKVQHR
jgi:hypothetical protein